MSDEKGEDRFQRHIVPTGKGNAKGIALDQLLYQRKGGSRSDILNKIINLTPGSLLHRAYLFQTPI